MATCQFVCSLLWYKHPKTGYWFHWPDYLLPQKKIAAESRWQTQHCSYALLVQAGLRSRLKTPCCAFAAEVITRKRCNLPCGCSTLQLHLTSPYCFPANLSGRFSNVGRKQKIARRIGWMLCLHPEKLSQTLLTPLHRSSTFLVQNHNAALYLSAYIKQNPQTYATMYSQ